MFGKKRDELRRCRAVRVEGAFGEIFHLVVCQATDNGRCRGRCLIELGDPLAQGLRVAHRLWAVRYHHRHGKLRR